MRISRKRKALLGKIEKLATVAGVEVDMKDLTTAPFSFLQFTSILLQLHKNLRRNPD
jgi:hypothetical protein